MRSNIEAKKPPASSPATATWPTSTKAWGLVSQVFNEDNLRYLQGHMAIGHTRYSTTGAPKLRNTQPYVIETLDGPLAIWRTTAT